MTQNRALQLLFDLRYLNTTLSSRAEEGKSSRSQQDPRYAEILVRRLLRSVKSMSGKENVDCR